MEESVAIDVDVFVGLKAGLTVAEPVASEDVDGVTVEVRSAE